MKHFQKRNIQINIAKGLLEEERYYL